VTNDGRDIAVPVADQGLRAALAVVAFMLAACTWLGIVVVMLVMVPKFEEIFRDFGVGLPWFARVVIGASQWLSGSNPGQTLPGVMFIGPLLLLLFVALAALGVNSRTRLLAIILLGAMCVLGVALFAAGFASIQAAMSSMTQSLQGGKL
jgi:type II secretory pathway component PulF